MQVTAPGFPRPLFLPEHYRDAPRALEANPKAFAAVDYGLPGSSARLFFEFVPKERYLGGDIAFLRKDYAERGPGKGIATIELDTLTSASGIEFFYQLVKLKGDDSPAIRYGLTVQSNTEKVLDITGTFFENGTTGTRDAFTFLDCKKRGLVTQGPEGTTGWMTDPYDHSFTDGFRRSLGDDAFYDPQFPEHPLTQARLVLHRVAGM